ncbi:MAG TPA: organomercurial lyase [Nitrososphaeraceae archaeon]|nr:organomercurial lyase [Nitrososphaeraceae archaeon]
MVKTNNRTKENVSIQQATDEMPTDVFGNLHIEQDRWRIIKKTLQLLANGSPIPPEEIAIRLQETPDMVISTLQSFGAEFDKDSNNIVGVGLTLVPTPHVYEVNGSKLYTWCALDALIFPVMLNHNAHIESLDPVSGEKIQVTVTPDGVEKVKPESAVVSWVNSSIDPSNIRGSVCHYVYLFNSPETASKWIAEHPGKTFYPVIDAFEAAKKIHNKYSEI